MANLIYLRPLTQCTLKDTATIGRKAAVLGELINSGFMVPRGFVLSIDALRHSLEVNGLDFDSPSSDIAGLSLPNNILQDLKYIIEEIGDASLAIRSSAVDEDLLGMSYAGQYESFLNVRGIEDLLSAVRSCWASAFSDRVNAYQKTWRSDKTRHIAVLIQQMASASAAGVAFSANPVTGERTEVLVSAVRGLGDRLVSGQVSPDEWIVRDNKALLQSGFENAITAEQALAVAKLAHQVESYFGEPQDIEWALADGHLWLLQARPITALPEPPTEPMPTALTDVPPGFWQRDLCSFQPPSPMHLSIVLPGINTAAVYSCSYNLVAEMVFRDIGGWMYFQLITLEEPAQMQEVMERIVKSVREDEPNQIIRLWREEWQPFVADRIAKLRSVDLKKLNNQGLIDHLFAAKLLFDKAIEFHFRTCSALDFIIGDFGLICSDLLGWEAKQMFQLLTGLPGKTTEPAFRMAELAQMVKEHPKVQPLLQYINEETVQLIAEVDDEFNNAFSDYLSEFGCRNIGSDISDLTLAEKPTLILSLVRDQITTGFNPESQAALLNQERSAAKARARKAITGRSDAERLVFECQLANAQRGYPARDDTVFYYQTAMSFIRYSLLELGERLAITEKINQVQDIFLLKIEEALAALNEGVDQHSIVAQRKKLNSLTQNHPGPAFYGTPPEFQASLTNSDDWIETLSPEAIHVLEVCRWRWQDLSEGPVPGQPTTEKGFYGVAASPGRYTGPVRVIMNPSEFDKLQPGDVLICPETTAEWSILFPNVGALVTDTGSLLSHPAIIAREYYVPAVLATCIATDSLRDGQIVTVDGSAGFVEILS